MGRMRLISSTLMAEFIVDCEECEASAEFDNEEKALGWLFGHGMRTGHDEIEKRPADD